jgi:N-acetyl sugar amidotransferase
MEKVHKLGPETDAKLKSVIEKIKAAGKGKRYDCITGVSGGRDSSFTLLTAKRLGLRSLAVHFDNGWNSEIATSNIKRQCDKLGVDLFTVVADWEEFKDLQIAFLKSATPDADIPTDYAIYSVLFDVAHKEGVKYILNGHSFRTEGTSPISWTYMDGRYFKSVLKKFGKNKSVKSFPVMAMWKLLYYLFIERIREVRLMHYIDYQKRTVDEILKKELDWEYYGGHHHENLFTKFFQSFYLPKKFGIDKRKTEFSALIRSGQISREEALKGIQESEYEYDQTVVDYAISKLGLSKEEFQQIMDTPIKSHDDYPTYLPFIRLLKWPIKIAVKFRLVPQVLYLKYAK